MLAAIFLSDVYSFRAGAPETGFLQGFSLQKSKITKVYDTFYGLLFRQNQKNTDTPDLPVFLLNHIPRHICSDFSLTFPFARAIILI